jgi:hypothetical protein
MQSPSGAHRLAHHHYRNEVPQHHHRDLTSSPVAWHSSVLSHQHGCGCVKFGTKRPQVQILSPRPGIPAGQRPAPEMVRASPAARGPQIRNTEGTPPRVLSKHGSHLVLVRNEEAAGVSSCHPDHSRRSLTCGNAVSCALSSIPQPSPQRPRGTKMECRGHRDRQKNTRPPSTTQQTTRHSNVPSGHCDPPSTTKRTFRAGTSASQESLTTRGRLTRPARDHRRAPPRR